MQELSGAVEAHRPPASEQLDDLQDAMPTLAARQATRPGPDRAWLHPARVAAPATSTPQLVHGRRAHLATISRFGHPLAPRPPRSPWQVFSYPAPMPSTRA